MSSVVRLVILLCVSNGIEAREYTIRALMPDFPQVQKDTHLCTAFPLSQKEPQYIVGFTPQGTAGDEKHMLIYGCQQPGYENTSHPNAIWDCDPDVQSVPDGLPFAQTCAFKMKSQQLYINSLGSQGLRLPPGVGFKVGGFTGFNYLVLRIHYEHVDEFLEKNGHKNLSSAGNPGLLLTMSSSPATRSAGYLSLGTHGFIEPHSVAHMEVAFRLEQPLVLHPFAFTVHTHKLGTAVTGWKAGRDGRWSLIGRMNPQKQEMYYPVADSSMIIEEGDVIAARCTMNNTLSRRVSASPPVYEEMCDFHVLYYVDDDQLLTGRSVFVTPGAPRYSWRVDRIVPVVPGDVDVSASQPE